MTADVYAFERTRPRLFAVARRVLGNEAGADDVVQDAWLRWQGSDRSAVRDPAAFLVTTTTRLALTVGQSAPVFLAAAQTGDLAALERHLAAGIEGGSRVRIAA